MQILHGTGSLGLLSGIISLIEDPWPKWLKMTIFSICALGAVAAFLLATMGIFTYYLN